ncbi:GtrA family protein [Vibrio sp. TRT 21S02]|uniref:GtrA family protein n=1 Tax=Vibrio sp. TRT 21S02 TaxID=3418507 RepID=UPI003CECF2FE
MASDFESNHDDKYQIVRYFLVGLGQNGIGYSFYLLFTWFGCDPKLTISILYPISVIISFLGNKKITFDYKGNNVTTLIKFVFVHINGYLISIAFLYFCHDILGYPHQIVQIFSIFFVAVFIFLMLKFYVFSKSSAIVNN